jgi:hypothetical protein
MKRGQQETIAANNNNRSRAIPPGPLLKIENSIGCPMQPEVLRESNTG